MTEPTFNPPNEWAVVETKPCTVCGCEGQVVVKYQDLLDWKNGKFAQDAFPYLSVLQREMLISRTHPECWGNLFAGEDY